MWHHAAICFVPGDPELGDRGSQPKLDFMTTTPRGCPNDPYGGRNRLCRTPSTGQDCSRIAKSGWLIHSKGHTAGSLDIAPETATVPEMTTFPQACPARTASDPHSILPDGVFVPGESRAVGVNISRGVSGDPIGRGRNAISTSASSQESADGEDRFPCE